MTTKIDWTRPIETTDGKPAKVLHERLAGSTLRAVVVTFNDGGQDVFIADSLGCDVTRGSHAIRNVRREPKDIWVNEYGETWYECRGFGTKETTVKDAETSKMYGLKPFRVAVHYREVIEEEK